MDGDCIQPQFCTFLGMLKAAEAGSLFLGQYQNHNGFGTRIVVSICLAS